MQLVTEWRDYTFVASPFAMPFFVLLLALSGLAIFLIVRDMLRIRKMPALDDTAQVDGTPLVSIIIPARNEAVNIARCLEGVLSQDYARCHVVVVDDGSTDGTPHILADFSARHTDRLRIVPGRPLPHGWVGKCNACLHGAQHATGEWLVFVDADTAPLPGLVRALMAFVRARDLDAVSVFPFNELPTLPERLVLPVFYQFAFTAFPLDKIVLPDVPPSNAMANGQCLMVNAQVYWAMGGHEVVKDKVLEDIEFAQALRRAGHRLGIATAFDQLRVRMYRSFGEIVQGLGKHASAGRQASGWRAFWAVTRMTLTVLMPPLLWLACAGMLLAGPADALAWLAMPATSGAYVVSLAFWSQRLRRWYGLPAWLAAFMPLGWLIYLFIAVRGTLNVLFKRGVVWKERVYS
jgi:glycosyltransferase involved in cell wall biosynthesis